MFLWRNKKIINTFWLKQEPYLERCIRDKTENGHMIYTAINSTDSEKPSCKLWYGFTLVVNTMYVWT